jgi:hypothetical protein
VWMAVARVQTCLLSRTPTVVLQARPKTSPMSCEGGGVVSGEVATLRTYIHIEGEAALCLSSHHAGGGGRVWPQVVGTAC